MIRCTVDTNVPIVANGHGGPGVKGRVPSIDCRIAAVEFLTLIIRSGTFLLDADGAIQMEYRNHLNPRGQPGVGDQFYRAILNSAPNLVERVALPMNESGEYEDLPQALLDTGFDPSDRKFAALARRHSVPVYNATDSDWVIHKEALEEAEISVVHLCGCDRNLWFTTPGR